MIAVIKSGATKKNIISALEKLIGDSKLKGIDAYRYCGKIKLGKDALTLQRELRDEWE